MQHIGHGQMDRLHAGVGEHLVEAVVGPRQPQALGGPLRFGVIAPQDATHRQSQSPQGLDVHRTDKSRSHHGNTNVEHAISLLLGKITQ